MSSTQANIWATGPANANDPNSQTAADQEIQKGQMQAQGLGGGLAQAFGGANNYYSNVQGPNASAYQNQNYGTSLQNLQNVVNTASGHTDPVQAAIAQAAQANMAQSNASRAQMQGLAGQLAQTAAGQGPSVASQQLQQGLQQQLMLQQAAAAGQRGGASNPFLVQRQLADQAAQAMQTTNAQMGQQRAQEALTAQNSLGSLLGNINQADTQQAQFQAQLNQQAGLANQGTSMQAALANQQAQQQQIQNSLAAQEFYAQGQQGLDTQNINNAVNYQNAALNNAQYNNTLNAGIAAANAGQSGKYGGQVLNAASQAASAGAGMLATSDERAKTNIDREQVAADMHDFLGSLDPASWDYRDPARDGMGRHYGVMAQSTERSPVGRTFTFTDTDGTKKLDLTRASTATLAALAHLHREQQSLKKSLAEQAMERRR